MLLFYLKCSDSSGFNYNKIPTPYTIPCKLTPISLSDLSLLSPACSPCSSHSDLASNSPSLLPLQTLHLLFFLCYILPLDLPRTFWSWLKCVFLWQDFQKKDQHNIELWSILPSYVDCHCYCQLSLFLLFNSKRQPSYRIHFGEDGKQKSGDNPAAPPLR